MRTLTLTTALVLGVFCSVAQKFERTLRIAVSSPMTDIRLADFDNDSLLDVAAIWRDVNDVTVIDFYRSTVDTLELSGSLTTGLTVSALTLADLDGDNSIDIVVSGMGAAGASTDVFINTGNFSFVRQNLINESGDVVGFADLDQASGAEMFLSGTKDLKPFMKIYRNTTGGWLTVHDSIRVAASAIESVDFDKDTDTDIFISGIDSAGARVSRLFVNERDFYFKPSGEIFNFSGVTSVSDLNHDGYPDILMSGTHNSSVEGNLLLLNTGSSLQVKDTVPQLSQGSVFTADFDVDGLCDISLRGTNAGGQPVNLLVHSDQETDSLRAGNISSQAFGDLDRDGDLDLVQVIDADQDSLYLYLNVGDSLNLPPSAPFNAIAAVIFNRVFLYWQKPSDDHTASTSLTYDVGIWATAKNVMTPTFDAFNYKRLLVNHGNNGMANYVLLKAAVSGFDFQIQAIDNAYYAARLKTAGGICSGSASGLNCLEMITEQIEACRNERLHLTAGEGAVWFSFKKGFLGESAGLDFTVQRADTIFSASSPSADDICSSIRIYIISTPDSVMKVIDTTRYVCDGSVLEFSAEPGFVNQWSSAVKGFISDAPSIVFTVAGADTVKLHLSDGAGCNILRRTALVPSIPVLVLDGDAYQVLKGQSVRLSASGGETYLWTPASGLDDPQSPNPLATPAVTTQYTVTITDSLGCSASGNVLVVVEQTAFVPNLFTPNDDGNNDELRIYGMGDVSNFRFSIYNREGSLVYSTANVAEAGNTGWNGTSRGVKQPVGIYYWKVEGETNAGTRILLNGKTSGSIVLIR